MSRWWILLLYLLSMLIFGLYVYWRARKYRSAILAQDKCDEQKRD